MSWLTELDDFMGKTAPAAARILAHREWMTSLRTSHPNRWVVYADTADGSSELPEYRVVKVFETEHEAVEWGFSLPADERSVVSLLFVEVPTACERFSSPDILEVA